MQDATTPQKQDERVVRYRISDHDPGLLIADVHRPAPPPRPYRWRLAILLFVATVLSTFSVGWTVDGGWQDGLLYSGAVMTILLCHEMGHFLQARRYGVRTSLPYFIPMPLTPLGTMGAVIAMRPRATGVRGLFDIAITGPIAGLVPTLAFTIVGLGRSRVIPLEEVGEGTISLGAPLLFQWLTTWLVDLPEGTELLLGPLAFAGWVGFLVTALNLLPIGQLDGGHILFSLLPRHAHLVSQGMVAVAAAAIPIFGLWHWTLLLLLLVVFGLRHPPLGWHGERLGVVRRILGWLMLAFVLVGLAPDPMPIDWS